MNKIESDGCGSAEGGQRSNRPDNTILLHEHRLFECIQVKYGKGLSWGDLFCRGRYRGEDGKRFRIQSPTVSK